MVELLELVEQQLADAENAYSQAVLTDLEAAAALEAAGKTVTRLRQAAAVLRGDEPINAGALKDEEPHKDVPPAPTPKRLKGRPCPSCGEDAIGPATIEIKGQVVTISACSKCSHQIW